jgi:hypothetical protein
MPPVPSVILDKAGTVSAVDAAARGVLAAVPGMYKVVRAGGVIVLTLDEGTGSSLREGEKLAFAGDISSWGLLNLFNVLGQSRESGRLVLKRDAVERVVLLRTGDVASVGSNLPRDRLGTFLVRLGKVSEAQLEDAQRETERSNKRIGQVLLAKGLVDAHELWSCIQAQVQDIFADVVSWSDGSFVLYRLPEDFKFPSTPPLSMQGLLLEAARRADEMSVYRTRIPSVAAKIRRTAKPAPDDLSNDEQRALALMAPEATVLDVSKALHVTEFDATRILHELLKRGLVELPKAAPEAAAFVLAPEDRARIDVFNLAFREIRDEVVRSGHLERFTVGVMKYLSDPTAAHQPLFVGVRIDETGALSVDRLAKNLGGCTVADRVGFLIDALNELTFFMLFQCGELLDQKSDENLGRRVRLIHASLQPR